MHNMLGLDPVKSVPAVSEDVGRSDGSGHILLRVLETLDRAEIPYCLLHGYESYPQRITSDVDCMISAAVVPSQLAALFHENSVSIGAKVVRYSGYYFVFAGKNTDGSPCFLDLHMSVEYDLDNRHFYSGSEVLESRRRHKQFWVPAVKIEFGSYLVKKIAKGHLDDAQEQRLSALYQQDPAGCQQQIARFWGVATAALLVSGAKSGHWGPVQRDLEKLRNELNRRATIRHPWRVVANLSRRMANRFKRFCGPVGGLHVVFLGPDGAGKSSVSQAVNQQLGAAFAQTKYHSFPPEVMRRLLRRPKSPGPIRLPHALPPRSFLASATRAMSYWLVYYTLGYWITVRLALARATLVMHDRHLIDAVVDPRRYRYGGPPWLLRMICRLVPKSDLVILLDAPPEVLQTRKQEVAFAETARQREAYLAFVKSKKNGHVVNAARPLAQVVAEVNEIILRYLTTRIARRAGQEPKP
jgi:thymidylate kinase